MAKEVRVTSARLTCGSGLGLDGVQAKRTFLQLPARMPLQRWLRIGEQISVISDASAWWIGDWLVYGEHAYPDRYREAIARSSLKYQTLRNYAWVARKFPASRRQDGLSFQHHFEVASLPEADQDLWLQRAKQFGWSKMELRHQIKAGDAGGGAPHGDPTALPDLSQRPLTVAPDPDQLARWERAAAQAGMSLPDWVVGVLERAAEATLILDASLAGLSLGGLPGRSVNRAGYGLPLPWPCVLMGKLPGRSTVSLYHAGADSGRQNRANHPRIWE